MSTPSSSQRNKIKNNRKEEGNSTALQRLNNTTDQLLELEPFLNQLVSNLETQKSSSSSSALNKKGGADETKGEFGRRTLATQDTKQRVDQEIKQAIGTTKKPNIQEIVANLLERKMLHFVDSMKQFIIYSNQEIIKYTPANKERKTVVITNDLEKIRKAQQYVIALLQELEEIEYMWEKHIYPIMQKDYEEVVKKAGNDPKLQYYVEQARDPIRVAKFKLEAAFKYRTTLETIGRDLQESRTNLQSQRKQTMNPSSISTKNKNNNRTRPNLSIDTSKTTIYAEGPSSTNSPLTTPSPTSTSIGTGTSSPVSEEQEESGSASPVSGGAYEYYGVRRRRRRIPPPLFFPRRIPIYAAPIPAPLYPVRPRVFYPLRRPRTFYEY